MFKRILIANRGEIACRIARTCRSLGVEVVAIYSLADSGALHVESADSAVCLGPGALKETYLDRGRIVQAALDSACQAVHPGYGLLSEDAEFASAVRRAGLVFVGPDPAAMELMGNKRHARQFAEGVGVPIAGGAKVPDDASLRQVGGSVGYPLLVKPANGGGGIGMVRVNNAQTLLDAVSRARRTAARMFASDDLFLERLIEPARHIEVQVFGTGTHCLSLGTRDCSVQRRHQKVVEEAPAQGLPEAVVDRISTAAVELARAVMYQGAGTVEFLVDGKLDFYFLEMNTRIQVEHTVTEEVYGIDLVEWQLRAAAGEFTLPRSLQPAGSAIQSRVYAEDPFTRIPSPGLITAWSLPELPGLRIDTGHANKKEVPAQYDPLLAKLIIHSRDRGTAIQQMQAALSAVVIEGVSTNIPFLQRVVSSAAFRSGRYLTSTFDTDGSH